MKVRIITTQFVRTDAANFKSVVQSLTGRDSNVTATIAEMGESSNMSRKKACVGEERLRPSRAPENLKKEELESVLLELQSFDEFQGFWGD